MKVRRAPTVGQPLPAEIVKEMAMQEKEQEKEDELVDFEQ